MRIQAMLHIPRYFKEQAARQFDSEGPAWVEALPAILDECVNRWRLSELRVVPDLSINFVCFTRYPGGEAVLKLAGPQSERLTEMKALKLYDGKHACRCIESDPELGAMLLERVIPGDTLRSSATEDEQLRIGSQMVLELPIRINGDAPFPTCADWIQRAYRKMDERYDPSEDFKGSMREAERLFPEIQVEDHYLLHGDLHHDNILLGPSGTWKAIDPQGVLGPRVMECGRFIQNHAADVDDNLDIDRALETARFMADALGETFRHVWISFFILHVLNFCWGYEMNYSASVLKRGADECARIRDSMPAF